MAQAARTFRIFVSSTFHDLKEERNALQEQVFPRLRELCMQHGARFQAIDLRWGVSEQASLDQQAMNICLGEIKRCQKTTPRPNFIVLLGDRYGWRPLPSEIPVDEFAEIERRVADEGHKALLTTWYRRDDNAVPAEYCLQPRTAEFEDYDVWEEQVERPLHHILLQAIEGMGFTADQRLKYLASATHQEIAHGALQVEDAPDHVFCFFRTITDLPQDKSANGFVDLDQGGNLDSQAHQQLQDLKGQLGHLLPGNVHQYEAGWTGSGASTDHIEQLCEDVYQRLSRVILEEVGGFILQETRPPEESDPLELEIAEHSKFGLDRARFFVGRDEILETITNYVQGTDPHPLAVWGRSGSGKSALMAKAIQQALEGHPGSEIVCRYVGATPESSDGRALLISLCRQISRRFARPHWDGESTIPESYRELVDEFPIRLRLALATAEKPLIVFLDALDQLSDADNARNLAWLPAELPDHVRLIVSTLPGECLTALKAKLPAANLFELQPMPPEQGSVLLDLWLQDAGRTLPPHQQQEVLGKFNQEGNGLPLYLKLAFEEARRWKSYTDPQETVLGPDVPGVIRDLFARLSAEGNHGRMLVSRSLAYLAAAKNGLTEDELLDVLSSDVELYTWFLESLYHTPPDLLKCVQEHLEGTASSGAPEGRDKPVDEKVAEEWLRALGRDRARLLDFLSTVLTRPNGLRLPVVLWSRLYFDLEPYLTQRSGDGTALLSFYHRQLGQVTEEQYLSGEDKQRRHHSLARYFASQPFYIQNGEGEMANLRKLSELLYQQTHAQQWHDLEATLTDFDFLRARIEAVGPQPLIDDYEEALSAGLDSRAAKLIEGALRLSAHVLIEDPLQAAGQLTGRLLPSELPAVKRLLQQIRGWDRPWLRPLSANLTTPGGPLTHTLTGHADKVLAVVLTRDGRRAVSASKDKTLKVWDLEAGTELATLTGHTDSVHQVAVTPDGRRAFSASEDGTLRVWDLDGLTQLAAIGGQSPYIPRMMLTPDGRRAITTSTDNTLKLWDLNTGAEIASLAGHADSISQIVATPHGRRAVSASSDGTLKVWDVESGTALTTLTGHTDAVSGVAITPDGHRAVSASHDRTLKVWDLDTGTELVTLMGHADTVSAVVITPDGRRAVSASRDRTLKLWDLEAGSELATLTGHAHEVSDVAVTPDGRRAISISFYYEHEVSYQYEHTLKVWDLETASELTTPLAHLTGAEELVISADGRRAVSAHSDATLKVWDLEAAGAEVVTPSGHAAQVTGVAISADGHRAVSASADQTVKLWDVYAGTELATLTGHEGRVEDVAMTADGRRVVSGSQDKTMKVWDVEAGTQLIVRTGHAYGLRGVAVTPDGRLAISAADDGALRVWDLEARGLRTTLTGHQGAVFGVAVTADGRRAVSASRDMTLKVWDLETGTEVTTLTGHADGVWGVSVTADGRRAVSASRDKTLKLWNLEAAPRLATLTGHSAHIADIAITHDGRRGVSASGDNTLRVWDLEAARELTTLAGHTGDVNAVVITLDGRRAVSASDDGTLKVWDLENGAELHTLRGHADAVLDVALTPDGQRVISASKDKTLKVWNLDAGVELSTLAGHTNWALKVEVLPNGDRVISAGRDKTLKVWDLASGRELATLPGHSQVVSSLAITPDGHRAVSGAYDGTLKVWDLDFGVELAVVSAHRDSVSGIAITADGRRAISASEDETLKVWDLESGTELTTLSGHTAMVNEVVVTLDGRRAVSASDDLTLRVWDLDTGTELAALTGHSQGFGFCTVVLTPDGRTAVGGCYDGTLKLWDVDASVELATLRGHTDGVGSVSLTPDGRRAVSASADKTLRVWDLATLSQLATFTAESPLDSCAIAADGSTIVAGDRSGRLHFLRLEGIEPLPYTHPPSSSA